MGWARAGLIQLRIVPVQLQGTLERTRTLEANAIGGVENVVQELKKSRFSRFDLDLERQKEEFRVKTKEIPGLNPDAIGEEHMKHFRQ